MPVHVGMILSAIVNGDEKSLTHNVIQDLCQAVKYWYI